ncbi:MULTISPECIES: hypothetical protein [unclassified Moorena]|nr:MULTISPECIES: hypothetical protein [unclassified Moorena]NEO17492.1 hypothetical protein [Moorena sp. SIO3E8]NEQ04030.1 hypothetical protein [Moorena sp. SIO3F7]
MSVHYGISAKYLSSPTSPTSHTPPDSRFPIPDSRFPIPDSQRSLPDST